MKPQSQKKLLTRLHELHERIASLALAPQSQPINMNGMPRLDKLALAEVPPHLQLEKQSSAAAANLFITNAMRGRVTKKVSETVWPEHEVSYVWATFYNPFPVPLELESVALAAEGVAFDTYPVSCKIASNSSITVQLGGKPLAAGSLRVVGVAVTCFGIDYVHQIKPDGEPLHQVKFDLLKRVQIQVQNEEIDPIFIISVTPRLPILRLSTSDVRPTEARQQLIDGESYETAICLENIGTAPITHLDAVVKLNPVVQPPNPKLDFDSPDRDIDLISRTLIAEDSHPPFFFFEKERLHRVLPLNVGESVTLPLQITGNAKYNGGNIVFLYRSSNNAEYARKSCEFLPIFNCKRVLTRSAFSLPFGISRGLRLTLTDVYACTAEYAASLIGQPAPSVDEPLCVLAFSIANSTRSTFQINYSVDNGKDSIFSVKNSTFCEARSTKMIVLPFRRVRLEDETVPPMTELGSQDFVKATKGMPKDHVRSHSFCAHCCSCISCAFRSGTTRCCRIAFRFNGE
jgi:hypothetical protein